MGYRDLNKYVFAYDKSDGFEEMLLNRYTALLAQHSRLFYNDWLVLHMNEMLRWTASDTLEFIFLHANMDKHRENLVRFALRGLKETDPLVRFWFLMILELSGHSFFSYVGHIARQAEKLHGITLYYLTGQHSTQEEGEVFKQLSSYFIEKKLDSKQEQAVFEIVDMVFNALLKNLDISLECVQNNFFAAR